MKIVIPGGTGQVGTILAREFHARGDDVVVLSRRPVTAPWRVTIWDAVTRGAWESELDGADVVINLAGRTVNCRYTEANRAQIMQSRVESTRVLGEAIVAATRPPRVWLQSSTATIYAHQYETAHDEASGIIGGAEPDAPDAWRFSIDVATAWERAADAFTLPATRLVKLRSAVIMSPDAGGIFDTMLGLVRFGLGGQSGDGRQFVSWIHHVDFVRVVDWLIAREHLSGSINVSAPHPLPNADFMRALLGAWGISIGLPANKWMLEIGAFLMGTETELVLKSRRVVPGVLSQDGFAFTYADWPSAAANLCAAWREARR